MGGTGAVWEVGPRFAGPGCRTAFTAALCALLVACSGTQSASSSGPTNCPQPRFTGKAPEPTRSRVNPLDASTTNVTAGRELYEGAVRPSCATCHGETGGGDGPLASQFNPPPRNFACEETVEGIPDGQLFWIIREGSEGTAMPGFGRKLSETETWQLVLYLRELAER